MSFIERFNEVEMEYSQQSSDSPWACVRVDVTAVRPVKEIPNLPSTLKEQF